MQHNRIMLFKALTNKTIIERITGNNLIKSATEVQEMLLIIKNVELKSNLRIFQFQNIYNLKEICFIRNVSICVASLKVDAFNQEEEAFGWPTTAYPQRMQILNILKPYLQLYELTVEFDTKHK